MKSRIWSQADWLCGLTTGLVAFFVYLWTVAPNVTLLDSGEFIVAAQHFGVAHPPAYPLWTLLVWLFQLLPLGNAAWEINVFSSVCGGLAVTVGTMLFSSSTRWMLGDSMTRWRGLTSTTALSVGLLFAFSFSMWSQATITEVYTLHALLIGLYLVSLYVWLRRPESLGWLLLPFFLLAFSFSNHQLSLSLAPLPFLAVLLVRRAIFWDLVVAAMLSVLIVFLGFAILSGELPVLKTGLRFFYCVILGLVVLLVIQRFRIEWGLIAYLPLVVILGLLPYAYMPLASSTNPPMNWAYTSTSEGFFFSFNRSQYGGSLSKQSLRSLGKLMGTSPKKSDELIDADSPVPMTQSPLSKLQEWIGFFWFQLGRSFTPLGVVAYFLALMAILRIRDVTRRTWVYLLEIAFVLAAILQPVADGAQIDKAGWWLQMPYHTYTNLIFALLAGLGFVIGAMALFARMPRLAWLRWSLLLLPMWPLYWNHAECSQRGNWLGWQFGHDMLKDLPKSSVVFGGTDPGRFVPTYMILGESGQSPKVKRDPAFDRRDLYIITQNGVGEPLYRKYLADQYSVSRPAPKNAFERWLGRADAYPQKPLVFPSEEEIEAAVKSELKTATETGKFDPSIPHSVVTRLIWEKNRDVHAFFVEESFPLEWSYDHALPHGLVYKITKDPLTEIPKDVVEQDFTFWGNYIDQLRADPSFANDFDAHRSFSKLRATTGNLYKHRKMDQEAERAYRQALTIWPGNGESLHALSRILWDREDFDGVLEMLKIPLEKDPNCIGLWQLYLMAEKRKELQGQITALEAGIEKDPKDFKDVIKLLQLYASVGDITQAHDLLKKSLLLFANETDFLVFATEFAEAGKWPTDSLAAAVALVAIHPEDAQNQLILAKAAALNNDKDKFFPAAQSAIEKGGLPMREFIDRQPLFKAMRSEPAYKKLLGHDKANPL